MIRAFHVSKVYESGDRPALHDVSLTVDKGEFVYLTGPSGAGKSTLLKLLFAAERPTRGQILLNERNIATLKLREIPKFRRQLGVVFQDFKLIANRTVAENVAMALWVLGMPEREVQRRVTRTLKEVGLFHRAHALPPKLSGGEQQRAAIARALVNDPMVLIADEPTGNLDPEMSVEILELLERANARGTTVFMATHDQALVQRFPKRTVMLHAGSVRREGLDAA